MDETKLREIYKRDRVARAFFDHMVRREHNQTETVDHMLELLNENAEKAFSRTEVIELFKQLQQLGFGQYLVGRKGKPTRFDCNADSFNAM